MKKKNIKKIETLYYEGDVYNLELFPNHQNNDDLFWIEKKSNIVSHNCHPRDNIALSWLSRKLNLSYDWFENIMLCREKQTEWLAELVKEKKEQLDLPVIILGKAFKEQTNLEVGSPAILLKNILREKDIDAQMYDPYIDKSPPPLQEPAIYFIGTRHKEFGTYSFPKGSCILDPWRYIKDQPGVEIIRIGE